MLSKKLMIRETNCEQDYYYEFLFEGESEDKIDAAILEYLMKWYNDDQINIDTKNCQINFGFTRIKWWINYCSREEFIKELLEERIKVVK